MELKLTSAITPTCTHIAYRSSEDTKTSLLEYSEVQTKQFTHNRRPTCIRQSPNPASKLATYFK